MVNTTPKNITMVFLAGSLNSDTPKVIGVGVECKQHWQREVLPNLQRALKVIFGKSVKKSDVEIWPMEDDSIYGDRFKAFNYWYINKTHITIVLHKNGTSTIRRK
jgi:hypothetical protein